MSRKDSESIAMISVLSISILFGLIYLAGHIGEVVQMVVSYFKGGDRFYINHANAVYCITGLMVLFIPLNMVLPFRIEDKSKTTKYCFYALAALYLAANFWIFMWLFQGISEKAFSFHFEQFQKDRAYMFNHLMWGSRGLETVIFNFIQAGLWYAMGYQLNRNRRWVYRLFALYLVAAFFIPVVSYRYLNREMIYLWWLKKSAPLAISQGALFLALLYAGLDRGRWKRHVSVLKHRSSSSRHHHRHSHHEGAGYHHGSRREQDYSGSHFDREDAGNKSIEETKDQK